MLKIYDQKFTSLHTLSKCSKINIFFENICFFSTLSFLPLPLPILHNTCRSIKERGEAMKSIFGNQKDERREVKVYIFNHSNQYDKQINRLTDWLTEWLAHQLTYRRVSIEKETPKKNFVSFSWGRLGRKIRSNCKLTAVKCCLSHSYIRIHKSQQHFPTHTQTYALSFWAIHKQFC